MHRQYRRNASNMAIIPCAGAAADGRRLGRGGGYYDRFLAQYTGDALLLCRERLLCPDIPQETHDIRVPAVVTERAAGVGKRHPHPGMPFPYLLCASSFTA